MDLMINCDIMQTRR